MTHLEPFSYPVWDAEQMDGLRAAGSACAGRHKCVDAGKMGETKFALFDYCRRDPLTYEADVQIVNSNGAGR